MAKTKVSGSASTGAVLLSELKEFRKKLNKIGSEMGPEDIAKLDRELEYALIDLTYLSTVLSNKAIAKKLQGDFGA